MDCLAHAADGRSTTVIIPSFTPIAVRAVILTANLEIHTKARAQGEIKYDNDQANLEGIGDSLLGVFLKKYRTWNRLEFGCVAPQIRNIHGR